MLTQRIVKAYAMTGLGVDGGIAEQQMHDAVALFEQQLVNLNQIAPNAQIKAELKTVEQRWQPFKRLAMQPASREQAMELHALADQTLIAASDVVVGLQALSGSQAGQLVNLAGRQRMLSQRLAGLYLYRAWGIDAASLEVDYATSSEEFGAALTELSAARENTPMINKELKKVADHWHLYQRSAKMREGDFIPLLIVRSSERILLMMDDITSRYAAITE